MYSPLGSNDGKVTISMFCHSFIFLFFSFSRNSTPLSHSILQGGGSTYKALPMLVQATGGVYPGCAAEGSGFELRHQKEASKTGAQVIEYEHLEVISDRNLSDRV